MTKNINITAYGSQVLQSTQLESNMEAIQNAGWTSLMVNSFHVTPEGSISYNGEIIIKNGEYIGDANWPSQLAKIKTTGTIKNLCATFGSWDNAFYNIQRIYELNNNSLEGTMLEINCEVFRYTFPDFDIIDMDAEYPFSQPPKAKEALVAFSEIWIEGKLGITFCTNDNISFWVETLVDLEKGHPGVVKWWNLKCYDNCAKNNPKYWAEAIKSAIPSFNTDGFILAGNWSRSLNTYAGIWEGDYPMEMNLSLAKFKNLACVGGAFIWNIDQIINFEANQKIQPDTVLSTAIGMREYVNAIKVGLFASETKKSYSKESSKVYKMLNAS